MAQIVKRGNHLKKEIKKVIKKDNFYFISHNLLLIFSIVMIFKESNILFFIAWVIYRIYINKKWKSTMKELDIKRAGYRGEKATEENLKALPDEYKIISDIVIEDDGKESQIDHIVIGPTGVYVIESKYWSGDIVSSDNPQKIMQIKNGKTKEYYHPSRQVATHVHRVASILKKKNKRIWVNGAVYFSNNEVELFVEDEKNPLFDRIGGLITYIKENDKENLNEIEVKEIVEIIKREVK